MDSFALTQHSQRKLFPTPVPISSGPVLISQQALRVPAAVSGQCGKLCAAVEATCPHLQTGGVSGKPPHSLLPYQGLRKPLCRLKREIKEGRDFFLGSPQTTR